MSTRKVLLLTVVSNIVWLSLLLGVFALTQTVQAKGANAPTTTSAPESTTIGPYYQTFSGADFHSFREDFAITRDDGYGVIRQSAQGIGVVGLHLPPGATITSLLNDSNNVDGAVELRLKSCVIGGVGASQCTERALASKTTGGRGLVGADFSYATNPASEAYLLEVFINNNNSIFYYARVTYTLPSSALFMPAIIR